MRKQTYGLRRKRPLGLKFPGVPEVTVTLTEDGKVEVRAPEVVKVRRIDSEDDSIAQEPDTSVE